MILWLCYQTLHLHMAIFYVYFWYTLCLFCSDVCSFPHCIVIFFVTLLYVWLIILILKFSYSVLYNNLLRVCFVCNLYFYVNIFFCLSLYIIDHHLHNNIVYKQYLVDYLDCVVLVCFYYFTFVLIHHHLCTYNEIIFKFFDLSSLFVQILFWHVADTLYQCCMKYHFSIALTHIELSPSFSNKLHWEMNLSSHWTSQMIYFLAAMSYT